jgi:hypothetical protein
MKLKQLFLAVTITLFAISCTKQDTFTTQQNTIKTDAVSTLATSSVATTSSESNNKAYIFIEPNSKYSMISTYLKSIPKSPQYSLPFIGFFGVNGDAWKYNFPNYIDMPYWYNGNLPQIIQSDIPQSSGGVDSYGNPVVAYNFKTVKISKNTVNSLSWIVVLIPVNAMNQDTKKQKVISCIEKNGNTTITNSSLSNKLTDNVLYNTIIQYNGTKIPTGQYRIYSTYPSTGMRINLNSTNDVYLRGNGN